MAGDSSYRIERILGVFAILTIGLIIFTSLTFFGIIDPETSGNEYCLFPEGLGCANLIITHDSISFDMMNEQPDIYDISVSVQDSGCTVFKQDRLGRQEKVRISIDCTLTAAKTETFKTELEISHTGGSKIGRVTHEARIKAIVS